MQSLPKTLSAFFWHFIKLQKGRFFLLLPSMLGWSVQEAAWPYFIKTIIDNLERHVNAKEAIFSNIGWILLGWGFVWIMIEVGFRVYDFVAGKFYPQFQASIRAAMFEYTLQHSYQFFSDRLAGSLSSRISRMADAMSSIVTIFLTIFMPVIFAFLISIGILYQAKPLFAYIMIIWVSLHFGIAFYFTQNCGKLSAIHSDSLTALNGKIVDSLANIGIVRLFAQRSFEKSYYLRFQKDEIAKSYNLFHYNALMKLCLGLASQLFIFSMVGFGIYSWSKNLISIGDLALILTSISLIGLGWYLGMHLIKIYEDIGTCQESLSLIKAPHDIQDIQNAKPLVVTEGEIAFKKVSFHYSPNHKIFKEKNVTLRAGEKVGLVGFSGSGKTTFVNLILRNYEVESGRILIDGQDIKTVTQDSLREQIALIPQDASLFHRTLMENIRYGRLDATDEDVIEASKKAHCHEFIDRLELGYHTLVGERGIKLSGGQRQRISIARAILKNAPILILDEATSALDSVTEKYIQNSLNLLMKQRTTLVVAHRLSTLVGMDRILVFKNGHIVEDGTHIGLIEKNGQYARLWNMQAHGFLPETSAAEGASEELEG